MCMNGWLSHSGLRWFHRVFPDGIVENYPGFPPSQVSRLCEEVKIDR